MPASPPPPSRLPVRSGVHSPRSASDPFVAQTAAGMRRSPSLGADAPAPPRKDNATAASTLPSIRSLRNAFQSFSGAGKKSRQSASAGPKVVTGEEAAAAVAQGSPPLGGNAGKTGGLFGFHRKASNPESPPEPRFAAYVQRPSVDSIFSLNSTSPQPQSTPKSISSPISPRAQSPLPPIPKDSPPLEQRPPPTATTAGLSPSPQAVRKLHNRISADFARPPNEPTLAQLRASEPRSQSLSRRSRRISNRLSATPGPSAPTAEPSGEDKRGRHVSASASLFSSAPPAELKDDLAYRRHSIASQPSPVLNGGSPKIDNEATWEKSKSGGGGWEPTQSNGQSVGLGVEGVPSQPPPRKYSTPFPSNFEPVPIQQLHPTKPPLVRGHSSDGTARVLRPISIPATPDRLSVASSLQKRLSQRNSQEINSNHTRSPSVRSSSPAAASPAAQIRQSTFNNPVGDSRLSTDVGSYQQSPAPDQEEEILDIVIPRDGKEDRSSTLQRSKSAIESARAHGETTGQVESGSPVFVIPSDAFADAGELGRRRSSASLRSLRKASMEGGDPEVDRELKERKERRRSLRGQKAKSESWGEQLKQMLAAGEWGHGLLGRPAGSAPPVPPTGGLPVGDEIKEDFNFNAPSSAAAQTDQGLSSPLDDLITELGGRRPSDVSSIGKPSSSSLFSSRGSTTLTNIDPLPEMVVEEASSTADAKDILSYPSPLKNRPPSAPPTYALPTTPIGAPNEFAPATAALKPTKTVLDEDNEQEVLRTTPDPDRTLTLDEMEREISRMEAELALGGRRLDTPASPFPEFTSPTPSQTESMMATPRVEQTSTPLLAPPEEPPAPILPASPSLERANSQTSSLNEITPRTARRWSIVEVERAYERMRGMLGSTKSFCLSEVGDSVSVEEAFEAVLRQAQSSGGATGLADIEDDLVMLLTPNRLSTPVPGANASVSPTPARSSGQQLELPSPSRGGLPSPSLVIDSSATEERQPTTRVSVDSLDSSFSSPPTSPLYSSSGISLKPSLDSLAPPSASSTRAVRRHTFNTAPSNESLRDVFEDDASAKARRRESDSITSRRSARRLSGRPPRNGASVVSGDEGMSDDGWATPSSSPLPPGDRLGARSPASVRASSRLSGSGALRSGVGKQLVSWLADDTGTVEPPQSPSSSLGANRASSRLSVQRLFAHESTAGDKSETETTPKRRSLRPLALGTTAANATESNTWYPSTPERLVHRKRSSLGRSSLSTTSGTDGEGTTRMSVDESVSNGSMSMASIRGMDKLEIFFKFTAVKADLDKAVVERDALQDALHETRTTLTDVRAQRDGLDADLKEARLAAKQLRKFLGNDSDSYAEKLDELVKSRQLWEDRAREAVEELERARDEADALRRELVEGRERQEQLEREAVMVGARLAAGEAYRASPSPRVASPSPRLASTVATAASSSPRSTPASASPRLGAGSPKLNGGSHSPSGIRPPRRAGSAPVSPHMSRNNSAKSNLSSSPTMRQLHSPVTPASKLASAYRARTSSNASTGSSLDALEQGGLGDLGSPLMGQTMAFGPKSSYGSMASPLKARSSPPTTSSPNGSPFASKSTPPSSLGRGQFTRLRLPAAPPPVDYRLSRMSTASSDYGDHLPPPIERDWNPTGSEGVMPELNEDDERFLADLSVVGDGDGRSDSDEER
ncbi:hypothetical protein BCR35DRAFT_303179 [Leucosporidium creatinivorum]|uniref:Proteophosphoglycan ppg4 n=1 Tax=Leucosporidium creatinivorum TaxID=106004 RepID=A0A1Y2FKM1_9BASI|nr:hypothetical protein BCR35DRAFT_303179 [Leucosporidium creatinivorum]